ALCAFLDESVMRSGDNDMRRHFEMERLQFRYFGVNLAGEGFFEKIELLLADVKKNLDLHELYHLSKPRGVEGKIGIAQK
ncbi:DotU family type IV/VI secretion system protein, partial [Pseudomonas syringae pv. tagetis]|uniref:DotU family type IV/VI secretion system protein n=1 Tax=Pseudomonas syringae group genomosp. 7 TaxID=251699 RepID=UPI0037705DA4